MLATSHHPIPFGRLRNAFLGRALRLGALAWLLSMAGPSIARAGDAVETKVVSRVYNGYTRVKLPDGSFRPETFVFAEGGTFDGEPVANDSVNSIGFAEVAHIVEQALKAQNYRASSDPAETEQMIMVWYGTTRRTKDKPAAYELIEGQNARILGFQRDLAHANDLSYTTFAGDFFEEFRAGRYFVVLKAYDFRIARTEKRLKLLWESRFSIQRQAADFKTELPQMARFAAQTFGQETHGILDAPVREGEVNLGELKILGTEPQGSQK